MSFDYLNEAFKKLSLLKEETFDTSSTGRTELRNFMDQDIEDDSVRVIDAEVDSDEDLQSSYIGKVITNCNVCHSNIFENKEDVVISEDGLVDAEKQCPYCGETMGFTVMGEVIEFVKPSDMDAEPKVTVDGEEVPVETPAEEPVSEEPAEEPAEEPVEEKLEEELQPTTEKTDEVELEEGKKQYKPHTLRILKMLDEEPLTEAVNNVNVETDDSIVNIQSEEDGKVTVSTEPKEPETTGEEAIGPVSDETIDAIEAANEPEEDVDGMTSEEAPAEDGDFEEVDFDEVDETSFDELGESYLKRVYENVDSFKTSAVSCDESKLIVEGVIKFKSGVEKTTGFIFEAHSTSDGKLRFIGKNEHFSRGSKSFSLTGKVENKKLISESLTYNYKAKTKDGKSARVYGTVSK